MNARLEGSVDAVALDLEAAFKSMERDVERLLEKAAIDGWAPERLAAEVDALFDPESAELPE